MPQLWRLSLLVVPWLFGQPQPARSDCSLWLLLDRDDGVALESIGIPSGERREIALRPESPVVTFLLPFGEGKSADLVRETDAGSVSASCADDRLELAVRRANGGVRTLPPVSRSELEALDLRINLRRGDGLERAFTLTRYRELRPASGPVLDLFGGRLPLAPNDWTITLEATAARTDSAVSGEVALLFDGEHLFAEARLAGGRTGRFLLDTAAASCVLARPYLPAGTTVSQLAAEAHGGGSSAAVATQPVGLGGSVEGESARATLSRLELGGLTFADVDVTVLDSLPPIGGQELAGILGLDLLRRARAVEIELSGGETGRLRARPAPRAAGSAVRFALADRHLFVAGEVGGQAVTWVVDTGAKVSLIGSALAAERGLRRLEGPGIELAGLDRTATVAARGRAAEIELDGVSFAAVDFALLPTLAALQAWGLEPRAAILGNDFWRRFRTLEFDFEAQTLYLEAR